MLQATITVQFGINCTATSSDYITHYNACYVIMLIILCITLFRISCNLSALCSNSHALYILKIIPKIIVQTIHEVALLQHLTTLSEYYSATH